MVFTLEQFFALGPVLLLQFNPAVTCNCLHGAPSCNMPTLRALYFWLRRQETLSSLVVNSTSRQYHAQCPISCQYLAKYCRCIYLSFHSSTFKDLRSFYHKIIIDYKYLIGIWVREVSSSTLPARIKKMLKICTTPFVQELWTRYDTGDRRSEDFKRGEWK